jgi:hypothetical protein
MRLCGFHLFQFSRIPVDLPKIYYPGQPLMGFTYPERLLHISGSLYFCVMVPV